MVWKEEVKEALPGIQGMVWKPVEFLLKSVVDMCMCVYVYVGGGRCYSKSELWE